MSRRAHLSDEELGCALSTMALALGVDFNGTSMEAVEAASTERSECPADTYVLGRQIMVLRAPTPFNLCAC